MCSVTSPYACAGREGEKRKTPYGGSTRVLGEPAAILYRLGSIINYGNSRNKKSPGHCARERDVSTLLFIASAHLLAINGILHLSFDLRDICS